MQFSLSRRLEMKRSVVQPLSPGASSIPSSFPYSSPFHPASLISRTNPATLIQRLAADNCLMIMWRDHVASLLLHVIPRKTALSWLNQIYVSQRTYCHRPCGIWRQLSAACVSTRVRAIDVWRQTLNAP